MVSARPPNLPMSRYTQRTSSSSLFLEIRTTSVSMMPALPTMPRPGSMMVSGIWLPKCLRSARKIDRPYCTTGGTSLRYLVGNPPPMLTMDRLIPRSAQSRNTVEAIASARSHDFTLRCWEPTWNEMPHGSRPRRLARSSTSTAISGSQPNLRDSGHSAPRSEEHTSELQSQSNLVCRLLLEKKKKKTKRTAHLDTLMTSQSVTTAYRLA